MPELIGSLLRDRLDRDRFNPRARDFAHATGGLWSDRAALHRLCDDAGYAVPWNLWAIPQHRVSREAIALVACVPKFEARSRVRPGDGLAFACRGLRATWVPPPTAMIDNRCHEAIGGALDWLWPPSLYFRVTPFDAERVVTAIGAELLRCLATDDDVPKALRESAVAAAPEPSRWAQETFSAYTRRWGLP